jgi:hypothetical protein
MKQYLKSKTLWANVVALIAIVSMGQFSFVLDTTTQASMLVMMNIILRAITKEELVWNME